MKGKTPRAVVLIAATAFLFFEMKVALPAEPDAILKLPDGPAKAVLIRACSQCHAIERVVDQRRTADEWDQIIAIMIDRGAQASNEEQINIRDYLVEHFGKE